MKSHCLINFLCDDCWDEKMKNSEGSWMNGGANLRQTSDGFLSVERRSSCYMLCTLKFLMCHQHMQCGAFRYTVVDVWLQVTFPEKGTKITP